MASLLHSMKITTTFCSLAFTILSISTAQAQTDTSTYDLSRVILQKKFTQAVTIKAADLEKMPFVNLSEAIKTWLYGIYGTNQSYVSVVDGSLNTDVNAYSIYDIDEITMVQNAATALNGITPAQVLLLVKTKRNRPGKSGIVVNGQTNLVNLRSTDPAQITSNWFSQGKYWKPLGTGNSTASIYNQYYLSGYVNTNAIQAGVSADYQGNAFPELKNSKLTGIKPYNAHRFKLNGYLDAKLGNINTVSISAGYVTQRDNANLKYLIGDPGFPDDNDYNATYNQNIYNSQSLWYGDVKIKTNIAGFSNTLSAGYQHRLISGHEAATNDNYYQSGVSVLSNIDSVSTLKNYFIKDDINYRVQAGKFVFEPRVNFTYRHAVDSNTSVYKGIFNNSVVSGNQHTNFTKLKMVTVTPSLAITYADVFSLQAGFQKITNTNQSQLYGYKAPNLLPFASVGINVPGLNNAGTHLSIFGSYAKTMAYLTDMPGYLMGKISLSTTESNGVIYNKFNPYKTFDQVAVGANLSLLNNKVVFNYNYSIHKFSTVVFLAYSTGGGYGYIYTLPETRVDMHRFGVTVDAIKGGVFGWTSNLNATVINRGKYNFAEPTLLPAKFYNPNRNLVTGGFINRFTYKNIFAGADVLYCFKQEKYDQLKNYTGNYNSFVLQNAYIGFKPNFTKFKNAEVFANVRNLVQNPASDIADNRKFYGFGFKIEL